MSKRTTSYADGLVERLKDSEFAAEFLSSAADEGRAELLLALRYVAQAQQFTSVARKASRGRESLYKALSEDGNPGLDTFLAVLDALKVKLHFEPA